MAPFEVRSHLVVERWSVLLLGIQSHKRKGLAGENLALQGGISEVRETDPFPFECPV